jgi:hypothetical protein
MPSPIKNIWPISGNKVRKSVPKPAPVKSRVEGGVPLGIALSRNTPTSAPSVPFYSIDQKQLFISDSKLG